MVDVRREHIPDIPRDTLGKTGIARLGVSLAASKPMSEFATLAPSSPLKASATELPRAVVHGRVDFGREFVHVW
jgi:hypothetical protein